MRQALHEIQRHEGGNSTCCTRDESAYLAAYGPAALGHRRQLIADLVTVWFFAHGHADLLDRVDIHVVEYDGTYSHNLMRNVAMENAGTDFLLHIDVDFFVPPHTFETLVHTYTSLLCGEPKVIVLPHFDVYKIDMSTGQKLKQPKAGTETISHQVIPLEELSKACRNKPSIVERFFNGTATEFHAWTYHHEPNNGTAGIDYWRWTRANRTWSIPHDTMAQKSEPLFAFQRTSVFPRFDVGFSGRGWNRISHTHELRLMDFEFLVAPDLFLCHPSEAYQHTRLDWADFKRNARFFKEWYVAKQHHWEDAGRRDIAYQTMKTEGGAACGHVPTERIRTSY